MSHVFAHKAIVTVGTVVLVRPVQRDNLCEITLLLHMIIILLQFDNQVCADFLNITIE